MALLSRGRTLVGLAMLIVAGLVVAFALRPDQNAPCTVGEFPEPKFVFRAEGSAADRDASEQVDILFQDKGISPGKGFAGGWIDEDDRSLVFLSYADRESAEAAIRNPKLAPLARDPSVTWVEVKFAQDELVAASDRTFKALNDLLVGNSQEDLNAFRKSGRPWPFSTALGKENAPGGRD